MNKSVIKKYAANITKNDIVNFAYKENISLSDSEVDVIFKAIHFDIDILLEDPIAYLDDSKGKISDEVYTKLLDFYNKYKKFIWILWTFFVL